LKGKSKQSGFDFEMTGNSKIIVFESVGSNSILTTGGPDVEYDYNNILAVYKTMYENASKMCRK